MKRSFLHIFHFGLMGLLLVLVLSSCTFLNKLIFWNRDFYVHSVKWEGETLSILAKWYTGSAGNWKEIAKDNPSLNPNRIIIGTRIQIPARLLITRNPMPKSFLAGFGLDKKAKTPIPERMTGPQPSGIPEPVKAKTPTVPVDKPKPPDVSRSAEIPDQKIPPAATPQAEPGIKPVSADTGEKQILPDKEAPPLSTSPPELEKKQKLSETNQPTGLPDKPLPSAPDSKPKSEKKQSQPKAESLPEKEELPLFGPKGYSN